MNFETPESKRLFVGFPLCKKKSVQDIVQVKLYWSNTAWFLTELSTKSNIAFGYVIGIRFSENKEGKLVKKVSPTWEEVDLPRL